MKKTLFALALGVMLAVAGSSFAASNAYTSARSAVSSSVGKTSFSSTRAKNALSKAYSAGASKSEMMSLISDLKYSQAKMAKTLKKLSAKKVKSAADKKQIAQLKKSIAALKSVIALSSKTYSTAYYPTKETGNGGEEQPTGDAKKDDATKDGTDTTGGDNPEDTNPQAGGNKFSQTNNLGNVTTNGLSTVVNSDVIKENPQQISPNKK